MKDEDYSHCVHCHAASQSALNERADRVETWTTASNLLLNREWQDEQPTPSDALLLAAFLSGELSTAREGS